MPKRKGAYPLKRGRKRSNVISARVLPETKALFGQLASRKRRTLSALLGALLDDLAELMS